jgi:hypothetical protein
MSSSALSETVRSVLRRSWNSAVTAVFWPLPLILMKCQMLNLIAILWWITFQPQPALANPRRAAKSQRVWAVDL